ncbi:Annexin D3 [Dichanthelium oligosanthes]|uniref:Annexin D3 n=1 Tax=Dichanthelium oligosanthes TaxID=888268 RepID=A0A1E5W4P9_9POAL|nr:Annexin D3 [Dichanthelium oligosanthes]
MCCWCCCLECIHNIPPFSLLSLHFSDRALPGGEETAASRPASMASISVPDPVPSATEDAENIRKAVQGWGTDEKALIEILGHRTAAQRAEIAVAYEGLYNETLLDRLHSELSGDFRSAMMLWTMDPAARDAKLANKALKQKGDRHVWVLIEVACASSPDHLVAVRKAYCAAYSASLEEDVAACPFYKDPLKQARPPPFLVRLVSSYRYSGELVDDELARAEAAELRDAVVAGKQPLHGDVVRIVSSRSKPQLKATFERFRQEHGKAIDDVLEERRSDLLAAMLKTAVWCLASPEKHFAEVIRSSIVGLGTDESSLTRAIVSRAEVDMKKVKEEYKVRYRGKTVTSDVNGDTSGYYNGILTTLVGPE